MKTLEDVLEKMKEKKGRLCDREVDDLSDAFCELAEFINEAIPIVEEHLRQSNQNPDKTS